MVDNRPAEIGVSAPPMIYHRSVVADGRNRNRYPTAMQQRVLYQSHSFVIVCQSKNACPLRKIIFTCVLVWVPQTCRSTKLYSIFFLNSNILYISDWNWIYWIRRVRGEANWQHQSDNWSAGVTINRQHVRNDTWLIQFIILSNVRQIDYANWGTSTKKNTTNHGNQNNLSD